jgi:NADH dehydrogenase
MKRILIVGGGFAGLWSAAGAARKLDELGIGPDEVQVALVNRDAYHSIRVRNYEPDLSGVRVPLDDVLRPIGVRRIEGEVVGIDRAARRIAIRSREGLSEEPYDRMVLAAGSQLFRPNLPGLAEHAFSVDTYAEAARLDQHLSSLAARRNEPGCWTAVIVGGGLTGVETACEMPARLRAAQGDRSEAARVIVVDHSPKIGSDMGDSARPVIERALGQLGIETRLGATVERIDAAGVEIDCGAQGTQRIDALTTIWTAGMRASPLAAGMGVECDRLGRVAVERTLKVVGCENEFAAGDVAALPLDAGHMSVMSCQHGRPMGRFAGHNVVCDLLGLPLLELQIDYYVTCLDLGPAGAVYTEGWDRHVVSTGAQAKQTKYNINRVRIYPPRTFKREDILAAAAPVVQRPPQIHH